MAKAEKPKQDEPKQIEDATVELFAELFQGHDTAHGVHEYAEAKKGEKEQGKSYTQKDTLVTAQLYRDHLEGARGLGIIPIRSDGTCLFGVVDVDMYQTSYTEIVDAIDTHSLPLVPFLSKSGGLHLYLFLSEPVKSKELISNLNTFAVTLGIDILVSKKQQHALEIFPKQHNLPKGSLGNWINLPYYDALAGAKAVALHNGKKLKLSDALSLAKSRRVTKQQLKDTIAALPYDDGPPCLQTMFVLRPELREKFRNNYLFAVSTYLKKKDPQFWKQHVYEINQSLKEPLDDSEIERSVFASQDKQDYPYRCRDHPLIDYCRAKLCATRDYGVGKEGGLFNNLESMELKQYKQTQTYYEWRVKRIDTGEEATLRFWTERDMLDQQRFRQECMKELYWLPPRVKEEEWTKKVNSALIQLRENEKESPGAYIITLTEGEYVDQSTMLHDLLSQFVLGRPARTKDQLQKPATGGYYDEDHACYYFRLQNLAQFISREGGFREMRPFQLRALLHDITKRYKVAEQSGAERLRTESGAQLRVYRIPETVFSEQRTVNDSPFVAEIPDEEKESAF